MNKIKVCKARFTLVELLAVVALMALLMGLGVPAFARMIRGSRVDDTARNIKLALEQAQMRAASERRHVAVIFPNGSVADKLKPYRLGGCRLAYVRKNDANYKFIGWVEGSDWNNAPNGAILTRVKTGEFSSSGGDIDNGDVTGCTEKVTDTLKGAGELKTVTEVKDDDGSDLTVGTHTALVFSQYGGVESTSKLYLLVSEAVVDGDDIRYPTAGKAGNGRTSNYKVLKVNNLTGRVEFSE